MVDGESLGTLTVSALKELTDVSQIQKTADNACGQTATKVITHPKCQTGKTFQLSVPDSSHSTDIIHQAGKILGTGYKVLERNGKILLSGVL